MRILIAEDELISRRIFTRLLESYGQLDLAEDGNMALQIFTSALDNHQPHDLVLLDIMMPKMDGLTVLKSIRQLETEQKTPPERRTKIIMITAMADRKTVLKAIEYGCDSYLTKPFSKNEFEKKIRLIGLIPEKNSHSPASLSQQPKPTGDSPEGKKDGQDPSAKPAKDPSGQ